MQVPIEQAYAEACQALGEAIVRNRIFGKALTEAEQLLEAREEAREEEVKQAEGADVVTKTEQSGLNGKDRTETDKTKTA